MADQLDIHTRSPNPDADNDDPLAELARIIGYERPAGGQTKADSAPQSSDFDLEAELMRELDVPQLPAANEPDLQDADERNAFVGADAEDEAPVFEEAPAFDPETAAAAGHRDDAPWMSPAGDETPGDWLDDADGDGGEWELADAFSADVLARAIEEEADPDAMADAPAPVDEIFPAEEPADQPMFDAEPETFENASNDGWDAFEPEQVDEPETPQAPVFEAPVFEAPVFEERAPQHFPGPFAPVPAAHLDDDVLADMFRFDLPARDAPRPTPAADVPFVAADDAGLEDEVAADYLAIDDPDASTDYLSDEGLDEERDELVGEDLPEEPFAEEWDGMPADQDAEQPVSMPVYDRADEPAPAASLDFEDFLSTELDDYEQSLTARGTDAAAAPGLVSAPDAVAQEVAPDDWDDEAGGFEDAVFDDAAEELLADIGTEEETDAPVESAQAEAWSIEDIETGAGDELAYELEDMVDLPERSAERPDETDELGLDLALDLEEVLADDDAGMAPDWDDTLPEDGGDAAQDDDSPAAYEGGDDWLATAEPEPAPVERDEMSEAFLGLVPDPSPLPPAEAKAPARADVAPQEDWLGAFETSETVSQPVDNDFYFDPQQITEADAGVEPVADFGVPEMAHDEPQPVEPDYDSEIEREFADIIEASDVGDPGPDLAATAAYAEDEDWNADPSLARGFDAGDAYSALERELDSDHHASDISYRNAGSYVDDPIAYRVDPAGAAGGGAAVQDRSGSRGPLLAAVVLGVAVVAGLGAFGWSMLSGDETGADGGPRIIRADKEPVKVLPENPGGVTVPNQDKAVYDRVAGSDGASPGQPALVNSAEEPIDVVQRTLDPEILPLEGRDETPAKSEDRLAAGTGAGDGEAGTDAAGAPVVSPRRVRTMIVKPDGSIVAREEPAPEPQAEMAAAEPTTVEPAAVEPAAQPAETAPATDAAALVNAAGVTAPEAAAPAAETADAGTEQSIAPVRVVQTQPVRAPVPESRPAEQPVNVIGTVTQGGNVNNGQSQAAPAAPAQQQPVEVASAPAAAAPAANPGGYYMQIASQPTEEGAQVSWRTLSSRYNAVLGGKSVDIQRADIPGKGVFHRVRVAAGSRDEANALCARYKSAGGSCFVSR